MRLKLILWEKEHGYTGRYVARKIGVSDSTWSKIKNGTQTPTLHQAERLQKEFIIDDVFDLLKEGYCGKEI